MVSTNGIGRRGVVKGIASSSPLVGLLDRFPSSERDRRSIVVAKRQDEAVIVREVNKSWITQTERARKVSHQLSEAHLNKNGVTSVYTEFGDSTIGGRKRMNVVVEVQPKSPIAISDSRSNGIIPTQVDDVQVKTRPAREVTKTACYNDYDYTNIPGGVVYEGGGAGTNCCTVKYNGDKYTLTASHLWDACSSSPGNDIGYQHGQRTGKVKVWSDKRDYAAVDNDNSQGLSYAREIDNTNTRVDVVGFLTRNGLIDHGETGGKFFKVGASSGLTTSYGLESADASGGPKNSCIDMGGNGVEVYNDQIAGDSGGPVYAELSAGAYMVSLATLGVSGTGNWVCNNPEYKNAKGYAAYALSNQGFKFYF